MILFPSRFMRVLRQVARADVMVLAANHAAKPAEIAFDLVGAGTVEAVRLAVVDALGHPTIVQRVPMARLVGVHDRVTVNEHLGDIDAIGFRAGDECQCATLALAKGDDDAALAGLIDGKATVDPVLGNVGRPNMTAEIGTVDLNMIVKSMAVDLGCKGFPELVSQHEGRLVLAIQVAGQLQRRQALDRVDEDADRGEQVGKGHLAGSENGSAGH